MQTRLNRHILRRLIGPLCMGLAFASSTYAQTSFPDRPIKIVVPFSPGGAADTLARGLAQSLDKHISQPVIVENRAGAGGTIGSTAVARSQPDGYTLLLGNVSTLATAPSLYSTLAYNPAEDFTPITLVGRSPLVFAATPGLKANNLNELIALANSQTDQLNFGSSGTGSITHLTGELMNAQLKNQMVHIPYKGSPPVIAAIISGDLNLGVTQVAEVAPQVRAGQLKLLGITGNQQLEVIPDIQTATAQGINGLEATTWYAVVGPKGIPQEVLEVLQPLLVKALDDEDFKKRFAAEGLLIESSSAKDLADLIQSDVPKWAEVVKRAGVQLN